MKKLSRVFFSKNGAMMIIGIIVIIFQLELDDYSNKKCLHSQNKKLEYCNQFKCFQIKKEQL